MQQLERRISRMQGERSNEEKLQLEARIKVKLMSFECVVMEVHERERYLPRSVASDVAKVVAVLLQNVPLDFA